MKIFIKEDRYNPTYLSYVLKADIVGVEHRLYSRSLGDFFTTSAPTEDIAAQFNLTESELFVISCGETVEREVSDFNNHDGDVFLLPYIY